MNHSNLRIGILIFFFTSVTIVFSQWWVELYDYYLVKPFFSKVTRSTLNDVIFGLSALVYVLYSIRKIKSRYQPNKMGTLFLIFISTTILALRVKEDFWSFTSVNQLSYIKYVDFVFVPCLINIFAWVRLTFLRTKAPTSSNSFGFELDEPKIENDSLDRESYASAIARKILDTKSSQAFAIGVVGEWGSGKTTFLNLIKKSIPKTKETILIDFNPWSINPDNSLINAFFQKLSNTLHPYGSELSADILRYGNKLNAEHSNSYFNGVFNLLELINKDPSELYQSINKRIIALEKKLIIFVDDIDRLDKEEIIETIRLIRNTGSFSNTCFIAAYDKTYILNAITQINGSNVEFFLEKIFQLEIPLPKYYVGVLREILSEKLKKHIDPLDWEEIEEIIGVEGSVKNTDSFIYDLISNPRDISRFVNTFMLSYSLLRGEVLIEDLFKIELLKTKFPLLYDMIYERANDFFEDDGSIYEGDGIWKLRKGGITDQVSALGIEIKEYHKKYNIPEDMVAYVIKGVEEIFSSKRFSADVNIHLSISKPKHFYKYFHLRLLKSSISETEFKESLNKPYPDLKNKVDGWLKEDKVIQLVTRLAEVREIDTKETFEKIIQIIFHIGSSSKTGYIFSYQKLVNLLYDDNANGPSKKFYENNKSKYKDFLLNVFDSALPPYTSEIQFIEYLLENKTKFVLSPERLLELNVNYLKKYLELQGTIDRQAWWILNGCIKVEHVRIKEKSSTYQVIKTLDSAAILMFKQHVKKVNGSGFFDWLINPTLRNGKYKFDQEFVKKVFNTTDEFELFIGELQPTPELVEFNEFYNILKANFFDPIEYEFQCINVKERT